MEITSATFESGCFENILLPMYPTKALRREYTDDVTMCQVKPPVDEDKMF